MTQKIFRTVFLVTISVLLSTVVLFMTVLYDYFSGVQKKQLQMQTDLAAQGVMNQGAEYFGGLKTENYRITWIGTDGSVLYDTASNAVDMENHMEREEVKEAIAEGVGESARYSSTLTERYLYNAKLLPDGTVLRLSVTQNSMLVLTLGMLQPISIILIVAVILSAVLASRLSKNIVRPLNEINLDDPLNNQGYDELSPLLCRIDAQQQEIRRQCEKFEQKKKEFDVLTSSMAEGLILLNRKGKIVSMNHAAAKLLNIDLANTGNDLASAVCAQTFADLLFRANKGECAETVMTFGCGTYRVEASPVSAGNTVSGIVLLLLDVTEKEKTERLRREFTANVSHELKTPLHTISGSAELMAGGLVKTKDIPDFSRRIYVESQRMIQLVEDIIKLSRLDEGAEDMQWETVDLRLIAEETVSSLSSQAKDLDVKIEFHGQTSPVYGIRQLLQAIVYNLCDNAVKYNRKGGSVFVTVKNENEFSLLSVSDTGIGIPTEYQDRVFERFYRVDKSHSKEIGGTGLGLSIVKHAAKLLGAEISLISAPDKGTEITVRFPRKELLLSENS